MFIGCNNCSYGLFYTELQGELKEKNRLLDEYAKETGRNQLRSERLQNEMVERFWLIG